MLGLIGTTDEAWLHAIERNPARLLIDHAHCEKKAAMMAVSLINRYPQHRELVESMLELAAEELKHFSAVVRELHQRGYVFDHDPGDEYVQALHRQIRKQEPERLIDTLLVSSIVEARSCERFMLLARRCSDQGLRAFYGSLAESEAQHRTTFVKLARVYADRVTVDSRLRALSEIESEILTSLRAEAVMHG